MHDSGYFGVNKTFTSSYSLTQPKIVTLVWRQERVKGYLPGGTVGYPAPPRLIRRESVRPSVHPRVHL